MIYTCPITDKKYDPLTLKRGFILAPAYNGACTQYRSDDPVVAAQGESVIVATGRKVFSLPPIDPNTGEGIEDEKVLAAVTAFTGWLLGKVQPARVGRNDAPCTDCPPVS